MALPEAGTSFTNHTSCCRTPAGPLPTGLGISTRGRRHPHPLVLPGGGRTGSMFMSEEVKVPGWGGGHRAARPPGAAPHVQPPGTTPQAGTPFPVPDGGAPSRAHLAPFVPFLLAHADLERWRQQGQRAEPAVKVCAVGRTRPVREVCPGAGVITCSAATSWGTRAGLALKGVDLWEISTHPVCGVLSE